MQVQPNACGVLLVDKSPDITSHDMVDRIRRTSLARNRRVGHAGTLDPFATGLLLMLIGRATRFQRYFMALPKAYRAVASFGTVSSTGDPTGELSDTHQLTDEATVSAKLSSLSGQIAQRVPMTSAVKVGGERLYRKARRGETVDTPVREVTIDRLVLADFDGQAQTAVLEIGCSSGTYVRQLIGDLGELCGCGAHCASLQRTAIGPFELEQADDSRLIDLSAALTFLPERQLSADEGRRVRHGNPVEARGEDEQLVRLTDQGALVAVAERRDDLLRPTTVLATG